jgi:hypothetical protein
MIIHVVEHLTKPSRVGNYYSVHPEYFELVECRKDWKVVIIPDGDKTTGKLYENGKVVKEVSTVKSPKDEYSMDEAIKVITERLTAGKKEEPKPKLYNGKVVCVHDGGVAKYTVGKIYQFRDGFCTNDLGGVWPAGGPIAEFGELKPHSFAKWIEVVE